MGTGYMLRIDFDGNGNCGIHGNDPISHSHGITAVFFRREYCREEPQKSHLGLSSMISPATAPLTRSVSGKDHSAKGRDANAKSATAKFGNKKGYLENRTA